MLGLTTSLSRPRFITDQPLHNMEERPPILSKETLVPAGLVLVIVSSIAAWTFNNVSSRVDDLSRDLQQTREELIEVKVQSSVQNTQLLNAVNDLKSDFNEYKREPTRK